MGIPALILSEAGLAFLGFGIPPPTPTWGGMLKPAEASSELIVTTAIPEAGVTTRPTATVSVAGMVMVCTVANVKRYQVSVSAVGGKPALEFSTLDMQFGDCILGRLGLPCPDRGVNIITLIVDAPVETVSALTGKLGKLPGVQVKSLMARNFALGDDSHDCPEP